MEPIPTPELWTKDTDLVLRDLVLRSGDVDWTKIAMAIEWDAGCVTASECSERYVQQQPTNKTTAVLFPPWLYDVCMLGALVSCFASSQFLGLFF